MKMPLRQVDFLFARLSLGQLRLHSHPTLDFLQPGGHDVLALGKALLNDPERPEPIADFDWTKLDSVVRLDHRNLIGSLQFHDGALWDQEGALDRPSHGADFGILPGPQQIAWIRKESGNTNR